MKVIKIYTGDNLSGINNKLYEDKLHPIKQVEKVKSVNFDFEGEIIIFTNSPFITEAFNKLGKANGCIIKMYYNGNDFEGKKEEIFSKFSKPFEQLVFGDL